MAETRRFAADTTVAASKSKTERDALLLKHGATQRGIFEEAGRGVVMFTMQGRQIRLTVKLPKLDAARNPRERAKAEQEERAAWRRVLLITKAKLEIVIDSGGSVENEFMANVILGTASVSNGQRPEFHMKPNGFGWRFRLGSLRAPARLRRLLSRRCPLLWRHGLGSGFATLEATHAAQGDGGGILGGLALGSRDDSVEDASRRAIRVGRRPLELGFSFGFLSARALWHGSHGGIRPGPAQLIEICRIGLSPGCLSDKHRQWHHAWMAGSKKRPPQLIEKPRSGGEDELARPPIADTESTRAPKRLPRVSSTSYVGGDVETRMRAFAAYARRCSDEKGDAQVFCDRLFQAFGHPGYKEAGAVLEDRVKMEGRTRFADVIWKPRAVIEMKRRGEKLSRHYAQLLSYWLYATPNRPRYALLCNFDEFWIYDFEQQMDEPMDRVALDDIPNRYDALNFLFPEQKTPNFKNNRTAVTDEAARKIGGIFRSLTKRGDPRDRAQRFTLQCVVAMFAEDSGLLPKGLFSELVTECIAGRSSYDLLGSLFAQMNNPQGARGGRFKLVPYFNGGIFAKVDPIELEPDELEILRDACAEDWGRINPAIFGTLFQASMDGAEQHRKGAHYTPESEIMRVVLPTIVHPWRERIIAATTLHELKRLRESLRKLRVLDPACGSGNFLYVAYRELKRLELVILERIHEQFALEARLQVGATPALQITQFFGIDKDPFAVELAKVTMVLAKKLAIDEQSYALDTVQTEFGLDQRPLPLENLDGNILCDDALFCAWPKSDVIIGNPPFQSKTKMQEEFGPEYVRRVRARYEAVPGRADFCVYWFRRAQDELPVDGRAGLVGTNTIRQNFSREGGLDYVVEHGGTITDAVSTQVWPGRAVVHVSIVNWIKAQLPGKKRLRFQEGDHLDSPWREVWLDRIPTSLTDRVDVTQAKAIETNQRTKACFQGLTHGHEGFLLDSSSAGKAVREDPINREVVFPYLTGDELLSGIGSDQWRYVIDFHPRDQLTCRRYRGPFERIQALVLPAREQAARREKERNETLLADDAKARGNRHHENFLKRWWVLSYPREELIEKLATVPRYIACARISRRPIFEFVSSAIRPNDKLQVFPFDDDYSFGVIASDIHWEWYVARCTTLKRDFNYNSEAIWDTFPWPQSPDRNAVAAVAKAALAMRRLRAQMATEHGLSLRELYKSLETPGEHPLKDAHTALNVAVRAAYGMGKREDSLAFILDLNATCRAREENGQGIVAPGLPPGCEPHEFVSADCLQPPSAAYVIPKAAMLKAAEPSGASIKKKSSPGS